MIEFGIIFPRKTLGFFENLVTLRATYLDIASAREGAGNAVAAVWDARFLQRWGGTLGSLN